MSKPNAGSLGPALGELVRDPSAVILASTFINVALRLCSNLVLAHLLMPRAFGLVAVTSLVAVGLTLISDIGIWLSIVRKKGAISEDWLRQLWTLQVIRGVILWLIAGVSAPLIAQAYGDWTLAVLLPVTGGTLAIQGFQSLQPIVRAARLDQLPNIKLQLAGQLIGSAVSIIWAILQPDAWALVAGLIAGATAQTVLSFAWFGDRPPRAKLTPDFFVQQLRLAGWLGASSGIGFLATQIDRLVFPALYGVTAFGVYGLAVILAQLPLQIGQRWSDSVYMPAMAKSCVADAAEHDSELRRLGRTAAAYIALGTGLLVGLGRPFFDALYPALYADAGTFVQLLAVATYASLLTYLHRRQFLFHGRMRIELAVEVMRVLLFVVGLAVALALPGILSPFDYVVLYALVQVAVYAAVLLIGRFKASVNVRDDVPAHLVFVTVSLLLIVVDATVTLGFSAFASLIATSVVAAAIGALGAAKLGLPKLPDASRQLAELDC